MKARSVIVILALIVSSFAFGQDFAFKVMANKGSNEVKSGDSWTPLKTGASLKTTDELKLADNAYLGLIHLGTGRPMEVRKAGNYKVSELAGQVSGGTSVVNKYADFILSSNAEGKKNKLSATGAVHRGTENAAIKVMLPENQKYSDFYNTTVVLNWDPGKVTGPYVVTLKNALEDQLGTFETDKTSMTLDLSDAKFTSEALILIEVSAKSNAKLVSKQHMIRKMSAASREQVKNDLAGMGDVTEPTAMNKFFLAGFYEKNNLLIDAITAYEEAVKLEPAFQESYDEFLLRNGLKK